jgi:hypothetical protein
MLRHLPQYLQVRYLAYLTVFKGPDASAAATRLISGVYPADLKAEYEPEPLPGFTALRDLDAHRYMPPAETEPAVDRAVREGDWRTLASLLDKTWDQWDQRSYVSYLLAESAVADDTWLKAWEQAEPENPAAQLVRADRTVRYAWELRSAHVARHLTDRQIRGFLGEIAHAEALMSQAIEAAPADPTPLERMLRIARGRSWPHERMERLWRQYTELHPHGFDGHLSALQYWCAKWRGSHDRARDFAAAAAENAPSGTFLKALPLIAAFEEFGITAHWAYRTPAVRAAIDGCLAELEQHPDAERHIVFQVRHLLAFFLNRLGRHDEAVEQFRIIDGHIGTLPWGYFPNEVQEYGWFRRDSFKRRRRSS